MLLLFYRLFGFPCASDGCVQVQETPEGFQFTSTIDGNDGAVTYTADEVSAFLADVKAGKWDDMHQRAREREGLLASV